MMRHCLVWKRPFPQELARVGKKDGDGGPLYVLGGSGHCGARIG